MSVLFRPGAFTPTCNDLHLPGYYTQADTLKDLGVSKVAVCTMNDRFVNAKWQADMEECTGAGEDSPVMLLSDPRGDLAESLGKRHALEHPFAVPNFPRARRLLIALTHDQPSSNTLLYN